MPTLAVAAALLLLLLAACPSSSSSTVPSCATFGTWISPGATLWSPDANANVPLVALRIGAAPTSAMLSALCACTGVLATDASSGANYTLSSVQWFDASNYNVTADVFTSSSTALSCLKGVVAVSLGGNFFPSGLPGLFVNLPRVWYVDLTASRIRTVPANALAGLTTLKTLLLGGNLMSTLPVGLFSGVTTVRTIDLSGNLMLSFLPYTIFLPLTTLTTVTHASCPSMTCLPASAAPSVYTPGRLPACAAQTGLHDQIARGAAVNSTQVALTTRSNFGYALDGVAQAQLASDIGVATGVDTSRIVMMSVYSDGSSGTLVTFNVLPNERPTQVMAEYVPVAIRQQIGSSASTWSTGPISSAMATGTSVQSTTMAVSRCPLTGAWTAPPGAGCAPGPASSDDATANLFGVPIIDATVTAGVFGLATGCIAFLVAFICHGAGGALAAQTTVPTRALPNMDSTGLVAPPPSMLPAAAAASQWRPSTAGQMPAASNPQLGPLSLEYMYAKAAAANEYQNLPSMNPSTAAVRSSRHML